MKRTAKHIGATAAVAALLAFGGSLWTLLSNYSSQSDAYLYVGRTTPPDSAFANLSASARTGHYAALRLLCTLTGNSRHLRPGRYALSGVSTLQLFRHLRGGRQEPVRLTLPVLRTTADLAAFLASKLEPTAEDFEAALADSAVCARFGKTPQNVMGLFVPNTYEVWWTLTPEQFLERMQRESNAFWTETRRQKAEAQGLTPDDVMTLASIVEQETANNAEKPLIAGLYLNRLRIGMKLQADPTVKFAAGQFQLRRIAGEILTLDSPYNTYRYAGLPPGPICLPSLASIEAVLNAAHHNYIYMCAKEDFSGTHNFAATYAEHRQNARRYAEALNQRGIKD